ncbi:MAG TPA: MaoC family dehydratase [Xanthobacteraceae bacterium]|nr:MaoC family dehydratase [Xanthobacteraceae bacterium]
MKFFDDIQIGDRRDLGKHTFSAEEIKRFARSYDPQPFHMDEEAARHSHFGALCASGWHSTAACMRLIVDYHKRLAAEMIARGERPAKIGPSPGFKNLKWLKPIYAGDSVVFASEVIETRASASRPQWGIVHMRTTGTNQKGERVYEIENIAFIERRSA